MYLLAEPDHVAHEEAGYEGEDDLETVFASVAALGELWGVCIRQRWVSSLRRLVAHPRPASTPASHGLTCAMAAIDMFVSTPIISILTMERL